MKVSELLAELRNNILRDRSDLINGPSDQLWSDETLLRYINEAQRKFARDTLCIHDKTTPACCELTLLDGVDEYVLNPSVLSIISARYQTDRSDLVRGGHSVFGGYRAPDAPFDLSSLSTLPNGKVVAFSTDESFSADGQGSNSVVTLRTYPAPSAAGAGKILLRVVRLPMVTIDEDALDTHPEIPDLYHLDMLDWAAYLALRVGDHDGEDNNRSQLFFSQFNAKVTAARRDVMRKMFAPSTWGFGRNGFTW